MANLSNFAVKWDLIVSDAWADADLKRRLLEDPRAVMKERGIDVPADVDIQIHENTESTKHFVLPTAPSEEELSEEQLEAVAGGLSHHSAHSAHSAHSGHSGHSGHFC